MSLTKLEEIIVKKVLGKEAYEQYSKGNIADKILEPFISEIKRLSDSYNFPEQNKKTILTSDESLNAYMLYFMLINFYKISVLLAMLKVPENKTLKVLDFGCGPGTGSLAALSNFEKNAEISLFDLSNNAENTAKEILFEFSNEAVCKLPGKNWNKEKYDLIIAANSLNEILEKENIADDLVQSLNDNGSLLILEPALKSKTQSSMKLRDYILKNHKSLKVIFPCTHTNHCPMLEKDPEDWCHGSLSWEGTQLVKQIDELTGFNKHRIKYSAFIFTKASIENTGYRVVSIPKKNKTGLFAILCGDDFYGKARLPKGQKVKLYDKLLEFKGISSK